MKQPTHFDWLVKTYFSDPKRQIKLEPGTILMEEESHNDRLYLIKKGTASGFVTNKEGQREEIFTSEPDTFLGVYSFFSKRYKSILTIEATSECTLAYIDRNQKVEPHPQLKSLEEQFMPVVVTDLMNRQQRLQELTEERHRTMQALLDNEKFTSLGQMAAGIAHELNNAISVLSRNTNWLVEVLSAQWEDTISSTIFEAGLLHGRFLSSREVRQRRKELSVRFHLDDEIAEMLAQTGLTDRQLKAFSKNDLKKQAADIYRIWEIGATFADMMVAAKQSAHVVQSVKLFGAQSSERSPALNVNESIENALALLRHKVKNLNVQVNLDPLPPITASMGELVQVWTNIINNACEAVSPEEGKLEISSTATPEHITVSIKDNGPGIPDAIIDRIFQPNVTTKKSGLSFGLGMGLPTVKRIVSSYQGSVDVSSSPSGTTFTVIIPLGGNRG